MKLLASILLLVSAAVASEYGGYYHPVPKVIEQKPKVVHILKQIPPPKPFVTSFNIYKSTHVGGHHHGGHGHHGGSGHHGLHGGLGHHGLHGGLGHHGIHGGIGHHGLHGGLELHGAGHGLHGGLGHHGGHGHY